ncbi:MAG: hypothetical protein JXR94_23660 [Candidatus Hydrogenedentes bacterium]|nr:hypothetical protein [Candidatus Hydrogenedentota bacterium]
MLKASGTLAQGCLLQISLSVHERDCGHWADMTLFTPPVCIEKMHVRKFSFVRNL